MFNKLSGIKWGSTVFPFTCGDLIPVFWLVRRPLRTPPPHLNDLPQSLKQVHRLVRSPPVLGQQFKNVVDNRVLGFGEQVRLGEDGLRNAGAGILAAKLDDDVIEV